MKNRVFGTILLLFAASASTPAGAYVITLNKLGERYLKCVGPVLKANRPLRTALREQVEAAQQSSSQSTPATFVAKQHADQRWEKVYAAILRPKCGPVRQFLDIPDVFPYNKHISRDVEAGYVAGIIDRFRNRP